MLGTSVLATTASTSTSHISEILRFTDSGIVPVAAADDRRRAGCRPGAAPPRSAGSAWSSAHRWDRCRAPARRAGRSTFSRPTSWRTWRAASRNGSDSMSPTVPPISWITTSMSGTAHAEHQVLDLVGDVRDHLHRVTQVVAAALLGDHRRVDLAGGHVGVGGQVDVEEALVVADVEIGLRAVLGDEDLAVLERVHGAGVHVQVRVQLLHRDAAVHGPPAGCPDSRPSGPSRARTRPHR